MLMHKLYEDRKIVEYPGKILNDEDRKNVQSMAKIFTEETDDDHRMTLPQILDRLGGYGVNADRKTLYQDFEELRTFGLDILKQRVGKETYYWMGAREKLTSRHLAGRLQRQVIISGRVKTMNESIYYNVDVLHQAISDDVQIRFHYFQWNLKKEMELRRGGAWYQISPWALMWDNENYYLVGYDAGSGEAGGAGRIKHYRVDKMLEITVTDCPREGKEQFESFDMPRYTKSLFGMFGGEETRVTLEVDNDAVGILIDRFGKDLIIMRTGEDRFRTVVNVAVSNQFLGWVMALGGKVRIVSPASVAERMRSEARRIADLQ